MSEGVRRIRDPGDPTEGLGDLSTLEQVPDMTLAGGQERIGLDVPGSDREPARGDRGHQLIASRRAYRQVVLNDDGLTIEEEAPVRVLLELVEHPVDGVDETGPEGFERPVPLTVPVGVRHHQHVAVHAPLLALPATIGDTFPAGAERRPLHTGERDLGRAVQLEESRTPSPSLRPRT